MLYLYKIRVSFAFCKFGLKTPIQFFESLPALLRNLEFELLEQAGGVLGEAREVGVLLGHLPVHDLQHGLQVHGLGVLLENFAQVLDEETAFHNISEGVVLGNCSKVDLPCNNSLLMFKLLLCCQ